MKSMTGFGKSVGATAMNQFDIEIKSVNHRFLDIQLRMPKECNAYDFLLRQALKEQIQRGRIEVFINIRTDAQKEQELVIHWSLLDQLMLGLAEGNQKYQETQLDLSACLTGLVNREEFFEIREQETTDEEFERVLLQVFNEAIGRLNDSRAQEGLQIQTVLREYVATVQSLVADVALKTEAIEVDYQLRLTQKLQNLLGEQVDESRLLTEVALLLEKGDIHEELDRLTIHNKKLLGLLAETGAVGRELDFLIQEMNREVNTIGSKSSNIEIKNLVVQLKTVLEKIREQIQNVE